MRKVVIYTQESCGPCTAEKLWLKDNGIVFEEKDIRENPKYLDEIVELGASATPATVVEDENGTEVVFGFNQEKLAEILGI
ncbi:glutaredoxin-like protein NrdH [Neobacillus niacini]|uniref:glutaredoxin family protein n=1 Tax=Neobacillus driksii TaxID=3035913 RepID=UPI00278AE6FB|nr:glutaredoxin family protein [Neobacillus niacini]MDQ0970875.1 glutaredoxin-like protein NrdH [Neobacillus niacini]